MQSLRLSNQGLLQRLCCNVRSVNNSVDYSPTNFLALGGLRFRHSKRINSKEQRRGEDGIQYHGFKYFPRFPDQKDPPYEPTKLFMVKRIRSTSGCPYWEKDLVAQFGLARKGDVAILKNSPSNNARLYKIKHLVEITPITTPFGLPDSPEHGFLKESGEFVACHSLAGHTLQLEESKTAKDAMMKKSVDGGTLKRRLHLNWYNRY